MLIIVLCRTQFELMGSEFGWIHNVVLVDGTWVWKDSKFGLSRFGPGFDPFLAEHVRSSGLFGVGLEFGFGVSSGLDLSNSKWFEVNFIWVLSKH